MVEDATQIATDILKNVKNNENDEKDDNTSIISQLKANPPPDALPTGWVVRKSHTYPDYVYYYHQETGECRWENPLLLVLEQQQQQVQQRRGSSVVSMLVPQQSVLGEEAVAKKPAVKSILKKAAVPVVAAAASTSQLKDGGGSRKRSRGEEEEEDGASGGGGRPSKVPDTSGGSAESPPKEVRVLHLLKKHRGSRRPASWRNPKITDSKEKAISDLKELISILKESKDDPKELRATFEELARTESDCSSAKRGGDLRFFGRKKMQPAFEKASFGLKVGELSGIVETSSGVHVILRLA